MLQIERFALANEALTLARKLIYTILPASADCGAVTALQQTPALSLIAIAYSNGLLVITNVRTDEVVLRFKHEAARSGPITSISFRTDGLGAGEDGRKSGVMATSCASDGDITFWDLNKGGRVSGVLRGAHTVTSTSGRSQPSGINKVEFLAGQPVAVSTGLDNSIRTWIFDEIPFSTIPRILHSRSGHAAPVSSMAFLPSTTTGSEEEGKWIMSAGRDRSLWGWSLRRDGQSTELSQGNVKRKAKKTGVLNGPDHGASFEDLKAPEITCMACSLNRDGGMGQSSGSNVWTNDKSKTGKETETLSWESVLTGHKGDKVARTWFWGKKKAGRWAFETSDGGEVKVSLHSSKHDGS